MTDEELIERLRDEARDAADRIEGLMWDLNEARDAAVMWQEDFIEMSERWFKSANRLDKAVAALRSIQTYLAEPAPEIKVSDIKGDLRWIRQRVNSALSKIGGAG